MAALDLLGIGVSQFHHQLVAHVVAVFLSEIGYLFALPQHLIAWSRVLSESFFDKVQQGFSKDGLEGGEAVVVSN